MQFRPFESDVEGTALEDFEKWMAEQEASRPSWPWSGWLNASLAFEGLLAAGPEFDREAVTDATNAMTDFTADGLLDPIDWTTAHTPYTWDEADDEPECAAFVKVEGGEFVTFGSAEEPWLCWDGRSHRLVRTRADDLRLRSTADT